MSLKGGGGRRAPPREAPGASKEAPHPSKTEKRLTDSEHAGLSVA